MVSYLKSVVDECPVAGRLTPLFIALGLIGYPPLMAGLNWLLWMTSIPCGVAAIGTACYTRRRPLILLAVFTLFSAPIYLALDSLIRFVILSI